jgi:hypothetical protein
VRAAELNVRCHHVEANIMATIAEEWLRGDAEQASAATHVEHLEARFLRGMQLQQRLKNADDVRPFGVGEFPAATIVLARNEPEISRAAKVLAIPWHKEPIEQPVG